MTWHLTNIPKIAHFYWGNDKLSFLRFMSVKSFAKYNPDWKIKIHIPSVVGKVKPTWSSWEQQNVNIKEDFTNEMKNLKCELVSHDFKLHGFDNNAHEVHKADFIRWYLLSTDGGLWSDIDIIYTKPMNCLVENTTSNSNLQVGLVPYTSGGHTIGFLLSSGMNNPFYRCIFDMAKTKFDPNKYQGIGCDLINNNFPHINQLKNRFPNTNFMFLNDKCVYSIMWMNVNMFFDNNIKPPSPHEAIGYHWYAGHPLSQEWDSRLSRDNYKNFSSIICKAISEVD